MNPVIPILRGIVSTIIGVLWFCLFIQLILVALLTDFIGQIVPRIKDPSRYYTGD